MLASLLEAVIEDKRLPEVAHSHLQPAVGQRAAPQLQVDARANTRVPGVHQARL